jgi:tetratricopeptide (TPR) repeat protein
MLHSFLFDDTEEQFKRAADDDPTCAMAFWAQGIGLYRPLVYEPSAEDTQRGWALIEKAKKLQPKTQREADYISAAEALFNPDTPNVAERNHHYSEALKKIYKAYPNDAEAAVFYALSLITWAGSEHRHTDAEDAIAILSPILEQHPNHPGVPHYLIHAADSPQLAPKGLSAARLYAKIAPASPHALHMPSHIFARLGLWQEDIRSNLAALSAARDPSIHVGAENQLHPMDFLEYAYLQIGEDDRAKEILEEQRKVTYQPIDPHLSHIDHTRMNSTALFYLETHNWRRAESLQPYSQAESYNQSVVYWAQAVAAGHLHNLTAAEHALKQYDLMVTATKQGPHPFLAQNMLLSRQEAQAWVLLLEGKQDDAVKTLRTAASEQEKYGKGEIELPAREMLGDMLMDMERPADALVEYEKSLSNDPNRFNALYGAGHAAQLIGDTTKEKRYFGQLLANCSVVKTQRPELKHALEIMNALKTRTEARTRNHERIPEAKLSGFTSVAMGTSLASSRSSVDNRQLHVLTVGQ